MQLMRTTASSQPGCEAKRSLFADLFQTPISSLLEVKWPMRLAFAAQNYYHYQAAKVGEKPQSEKGGDREQAEAIACYRYVTCLFKHLAGISTAVA